MTRRALVAALLGLSLAVPQGHAAARDCRQRLAGLDLQTATIGDLQRAMAQHRLTSRQLVDRYLDRIRAYDKPVNSIRSLNPRARSEASRLDAERRAGHVRGPL